MNLRSPNYDLRVFSESVKDLDILEIQDAVLEEIHAISMDCKKLGFGYMPKKGSKARKYYDDLRSIVPLYAGILPEFREGFIDEARPMLIKMAQYLVSLKDLKFKAER